MKKGAHIKYIDIIKGMYNEIVASIGTYRGLISDFSNAIRLHQRCTLSLFLHVIMMDQLTKPFRIRYLGLYHLVIILS